MQVLYSVYPWILLHYSKLFFTSVFTDTKNVIDHFHCMFFKLKSKNTRSTQGLHCSLEKCVLLTKYFYLVYDHCFISRYGYGIFVHYRSHVIIKTPQTYDLKWNTFRSFSPKVWIAVGFTVVLLSVSLAAIEFMTRQHGLQDVGDYTLTTFIFIVFSAYCQKGNIVKR